LASANSKEESPETTKHATLAKLPLLLLLLLVVARKQTSRQTGKTNTKR
jgi:hypothetical protein